MNHPSHSSDMLEQLKSLSIERDPKPEEFMAKPGTGLSGRKIWLALALLIPGAGFAAWQFDLRPEVLFEHARGLTETTTTAALPTEAAPSAAAQTGTENASQVAPAPLPPAVVGSGYVVAERELRLMPDMGGRIESVAIQTGDRVIAGQIIAVLNSDTARSNLRIAEANLAMALATQRRSEAMRDEAQANLARRVKLAERGSAAGVEVEAARFALARIDRDLDVAAQAVAIAGLERDQRADLLLRHEVRAPFDGVVIKRHMNQGDIAVSGLEGGPGQPIATVMDPSDLIIEVDVAENHLSRIMAGQPARVQLDAYPSQEFAAVVKTISPKLSIQRGTVEVRLAFDTPPMGVFANMAAKVTFGSRDQTAEIQQKGY